MFLWGFSRFGFVDTIIGGTSDDRFFFGDDDEDYVNTRSGNDVREDRLWCGEVS